MTIPEPKKTYPPFTREWCEEAAKREPDCDITVGAVRDPQMKAEFHAWLVSIKEVADLWDAWKAALVASDQVKCICDVHPWCPRGEPNGS
jgi:hypothetical protein